MTVLLILVALVGWIGTVVPVLPGAALIFAAALVHGLATNFQPIDVSLLWILGLLAAGAEGAGYIVASMGARRYGAGRAGVVGSFVGLIVGLFTLGPLGLLVGPLFGAIAAEALTGRPFDEALRAGVGAALGGVGGLALRFAFGSIMLFLIVRALFF